MIFRCESCRGLGSNSTGKEWPESCRVCSGTGKFTLATLGKKLDEDPRVLENVCELRCQYRTARRDI